MLKLVTSSRSAARTALGGGASPVWGIPLSEGLFSLNGVALHHLTSFILFLFFLRIHVSAITLFAGVYAGIKFFIIDFLFKSCPKLRDKYDTPYIVWNSLPTDPQLKERTNATVSRRVRRTDPNTNPHAFSTTNTASCLRFLIYFIYLIFY